MKRVILCNNNPIIEQIVWKQYKRTAIRLVFIYGELYVRVMVFNATFNNISVISLWSVLLVEETWVPGETHRPVASHWQTLSSTPRHEPNSNSHMLAVICSDCKGGCKFNYHTLTTTTNPVKLFTYSISVND